MNLKYQKLYFKKLGKKDIKPYDLLLLADPSKKMVDEYLTRSEVFIAEHKKYTLGIIVLCPLTKETLEIKNLAVSPVFQGQGVGSFLINNAIKFANSTQQKSICIGTANSSILQIYLYQKLGFELSGIKKGFFTENYPEPIYENGIQAIDMLVFEKILK